jgi:hypothetical protein
MVYSYYKIYLQNVSCMFISFVRFDEILQCIIGLSVRKYKKTF